MAAAAANLRLQATASGYGYRLTTGLHCLTCTDLIKKYIIQYCGTWYKSDHGGFAAMFASLTYLRIYGNEYDDEEANEYHYEEPWVANMCGLMTHDDTSPNVEKEKDHNQPSSSSTLIKKVFARMGDVM